MSTLKHIKTEDLMHHLKLLDAYPPKTFAIKVLDVGLILHIEKNKLDFNDFLINIAVKNELKFMYSCFHNTQIKLKIKKNEYCVCCAYLN